MALPMRVLLIKSESATMMTAVTTSVARVMPSIYTPPMWTVGSATIVGNAFCSEP